MGEHRGERRSEQQRVTIAEAASILGISKDAVRMRVRRKSLRSEKDEGRVYVWLDTDLHGDLHGDDTGPDVEAPALVEELRDRVRSLEGMLEREREARTEERRRHDTLMAQLMQRLPAIEAPREAPEAPETVEEEPESAEPHPDAPGAQEGVEHDASTLREWTGDVEARPRPDAPGAQESVQRPWWRRMFGG